MNPLSEIREALAHLLFPHICCGCSSDRLNRESALCIRCLQKLPGTGFEMKADNPVEKKFWGRMPVQYGMAQYYFTPGSLLQQLMHQLKYKGCRELGLQLGRIMGECLLRANWTFIDALVPLPLFPTREKERGYNQARVLCEGIAEKMCLPILNQAVSRPASTETQTQKNRIERWLNIEGRFQLSDAEAVRNKHLLLVDDVITTGATLEACGVELLKGQNVALSIAALSYASR